MSMFFEEHNQYGERVLGDGWEFWRAKNKRPVGCACNPTLTCKFCLEGSRIKLETTGK